MKLEMLTIADTHIAQIPIQSINQLCKVDVRNLLTYLYQTPIYWVDMWFGVTPRIETQKHNVLFFE